MTSLIRIRPGARGKREFLAMQLARHMAEHPGQTVQVVAPTKEQANALIARVMHYERLYALNIVSNPT
jgi:hypothetical protein